MTDFWTKFLSGILVFIALSFCGFAQPVDLVPYSRSVQTPDSVSHSEALGLFLEDSAIIEGSTTFGFSQNYFWILVSPAISNINERFVLDVDNPHIDRILAYQISNGEFEFLGQSGDRIAFNRRTEENRRNVFHVTFKKSTDSLLLVVDKRNASVAVPLKLWKYDEFQRHESRSNMVYGLYFGMLLLIMLYSVLIYVVQRSSIYIWYTVYVLSMFLYLFVLVGYGFQFLFPEHYEWSNYMRLIMIVLMVVSQIRFTQLYIPIKTTAPRIYKAFNLIIAALLVILLWWIVGPGLFTTYTIVVINVIYVFIGITVLLMLASLFFSRKKAKTAVLFYAAAFGMNGIAVGLMIAEEYGAISAASFPLPPLFIGSFFEILIFAIGLSYRSKLIGDDRRKLLADINHLQQQAMQSFVRGMEEEKVRVANELHDDVASRLSLLAIKLNEYSDEELEGQIKIIKEGVRRISHQLNPVALDEETFLGMAKQLVSEYRSMGVNIDFQVFDVGTFIPQEIGLQLYRVLQEALQNMQKHSEAALAEIQIFQHGNELVMTIEDDGVGFEQTESQVGLGLKNMQLRIEQVGGQFSISSAVDEGTSIMVSVPFNVE